MLNKNSGEYRLMLGCLDQALDYLLNNRHATTRRNKTRFREAYEWFFADDTAWPFSAINLCAGIGLDLGYLRRGLKAMIMTDSPWIGRRLTIARFREQYIIDYDSRAEDESERKYGKRAA